MAEWIDIDQSEDPCDFAVNILAEKFPEAHRLDLIDHARAQLSEMIGCEVEKYSNLDALLFGFITHAVDCAFKEVDRALGLDPGTFEHALEDAGFYVSSDEVGRRESAAVGWDGLRKAVDATVDWRRRFDAGEFDDA